MLRKLQSSLIVPSNLLCMYQLLPAKKNNDENGTKFYSSHTQQRASSEKFSQRWVGQVNQTDGPSFTTHRDDSLTRQTWCSTVQASQWDKIIDFYLRSWFLNSLQKIIFEMILLRQNYWDDSLTRQTWWSIVLLSSLHGGEKVSISILIFIFAVFAK